MISLEQLRETGISDDQVIRWVREKRLRRLHRGVYAAGHTRLIDHAHLIAALLGVRLGVRPQPSQRGRGVGPAASRRHGDRDHRAEGRQAGAADRAPHT